MPWNRTEARRACLACVPPCTGQAGQRVSAVCIQASPSAFLDILRVDQLQHGISSERQSRACQKQARFEPDSTEALGQSHKVLPDHAISPAASGKQRALLVQAPDWVRSVDTNSLTAQTPLDVHTASIPWHAPVVFLPLVAVSALHDVQRVRPAWIGRDVVLAEVHVGAVQQQQGACLDLPALAVEADTDLPASVCPSAAAQGKRG